MAMSPDGTGNEEEDLYIFSTVRYDPLLVDSAQNTAASCNKPCPFYLLEHQWTRMQVAKWSTSIYSNGDKRNSGCGGGTPAAFLYGLLSAVRQWQQSHPSEKAEALRVRIRAYVSGRMTTEIVPMVRDPMSVLFPSTFHFANTMGVRTPWTVVLDSETTEAAERTMFKTSDRSAYSRARATAGIMSFTEPREVLLYNSDNEVLDCSIATPYFHREGRWVTPSSSCGGLQGTTRRWALENGLCFEEVLPIDSLRPGEIMWLSNAVKAFYPAIYVVASERRSEPPDADICERISRQLR